MARTSNRTFPFSGVDAVMRALDEPDRPQTIELEVAVRGHLDEARLRQAVLDAAARHPMARARQRPANPFDANDTWEIIDGGGLDTVEVLTATDAVDVDAARDGFVSRHVDVTRGPPFRVLLVHDAAGTSRVLLSVTHVAFDGIGALRLLQSISRLYAGEDDPAPAVDALAARDAVEVLVRRRRHAAPSRPPTAVGSVRPPTRMARGEGGATSGFGVLHVTIDVAELATPGAGTVNDLLHAALQLAIARWNDARGAPCERITVMMPVNQRPAAWRGDVLANLVLSDTIATTTAERTTPEGILAVVRRQTALIKGRGVVGTTDPLPRRTPVLLRRLLPHLIDVVARHTADTAVLSNLGAVEDPPWFGLEGEGLWFGPPPRRPLFLTIGASAAGGRLGISLRWCREDLAAPDAEVFADLLVEAIGEIRAAATAP